MHRHRQLALTGAAVASGLSRARCRAQALAKQQARGCRQQSVKPRKLWPKLRRRLRSKCYGADCPSRRSRMSLLGKRRWWLALRLCKLVSRVTSAGRGSYGGPRLDGRRTLVKSGYARPWVRSCRISSEPRLPRRQGWIGYGSGVSPR